MSGIREEVRVVLVGRTGLEAAVRRARGITLLRPRGALDAIGELTEDALPNDGVRTVVLAGADAVPSDRAAGFVSAVRRIDAHARVYGVDAEDGSAFDGVVSAAGSAADVLNLVRPGQPEPARAPRAAPERTARAADDTSRPQARVRSEPAPAAPTRATDQPPSVLVPPLKSLPSEGTADARSTSQDPSPLGALISGRDPVEAALASIRTLLGRDAKFVPATSRDAAPPEGHAIEDGAPVEYGERLLGRLFASGMSRADLSREAAWLAGWVMVAHQQEQLRRAAFTDELTGAWNRRYFNRFLNAAIDAAQTSRRTITLLVFDIDNFKHYNDRYGHGAGDEILIETVRLLNSVIRPSDRVCRIGGDEFAVVFHEPEGPRNPSAPSSGRGPATVADIARRFQKAICEHRFPKLLEEAPGTLTISGGLASYPWDGSTAEALLERADGLALQSKRQGKNALTIGPGAERACELGG